MANLELIELIDSRKQELTRDGAGFPRLSRLVLHYRLTGTDNEEEARELVAAATPGRYDDLQRRTIRIEPEWVNEQGQDGIWRVEVEYQSAERVATGMAVTPIGPGEEVWWFDTSGGQMHITQALEHIGDYVPQGQQAWSHKGAINVQQYGQDRVVQGTDIHVPIYRWAETHSMNDSRVNYRYRGTLYRLTGKVNNAPFRGCEKGECLFLGASGNRRAGGDWLITFHFAASPTLRNHKVQGTNITVPLVEGWHYMWVEYKNTLDGTVMVKRPVAVHVERVYDYGDFSELGI